MAEKAISASRIEVDETGQAREVENSVQAKHVFNAGDLPEVPVDANGVSIMVGIDGKLRRTTTQAMMNWLHEHIQESYSVNIPYVDEATGHWMTYDATQDGYVDTGVMAQGTDGTPAGFGAPIVSIDDGVGTPSVEISATGPDTAKVFNLAFHNLKGANGKRGRGNTRLVVGTSAAGWTADDCDYLCDGTDDQAEINQALSALPAGGGNVVLLDGTYNISAPINIVKNYTVLSGCGPSTVLKRGWDDPSNAGNAVIGSTSTHSMYIEISKMKIDGQCATHTYQWNCGISSYQYASITEVTFENCSIGILANGGYSTISGCTFIGCSYQGIQCNQNYREGNRIINNIFRSCAEGIYERGSAYDVIAGNTFEMAAGSGNGIAMSGSCCLAIGNTFSGGACGVYVGHESRGNSVIGNMFRSEGSGVGINAASVGGVYIGNTLYQMSIGIQLHGCHQSTITGNTCYSCGIGIEVSGNQNSYTAHQNTVSNNLCYGFTVCGISIGHYAERNHVSGNTCVRGSGTADDYTTTQYTIKLEPASNWEKCFDNVVENNIILGKGCTFSATIGAHNVIENNRV